MNRAGYCEMDWTDFRTSKKDEALPPQLKQYMDKLYQRAWDEYAAAGYPFGRNDTAMYIWYNFNQQTREN